MKDYPAKNPEDYSSHNTERNLDYAPPFTIMTTRINDRNCCYHGLAHPVFLDMIVSRTVFRRGNRCAQVYATDFRWAQIFPMASRSEAHETLLLLFT